jgi:hypothetical protein
MADETTTRRDPFDRIIGTIDGLPDVRKSRPSTVTTVMPMIGNAQTYVVQTYAGEDGNFIFLQMVDAEGRARIAIPPKVAAAIYRQAESLVRAGRRERGRRTWEQMPEHVRSKRIATLRAGRKAAGE